MFDVLNDIRGIRKRSPELIAMKDPKSGDLILSSEQLKTAALEYCYNLLQNNNSDPDYEKAFYIENLLHYHRSNRNDDQQILEYRDFETRIAKKR